MDVEKFVKEFVGCKKPIGDELITTRMAVILVEAAIARDREERRDEVYQDILSMRNVETQCKACSGLGVKTYPSTATWAGGIGGQMITPAVCDKCWGSGDANRPWTSLKKLKPDPLSADLVRLAEVVTGRTNCVWKCISWIDSGDNECCGLQFAKPEEPFDRQEWFGYPQAAVDAALREIDSTKGEYSGKQKKHITGFLAGYGDETP